MHGLLGMQCQNFLREGGHSAPHEAVAEDQTAVLVETCLNTASDQLQLRDSEPPMMHDMSRRALTSHSSELEERVNES